MKKILAREFFMCCLEVYKNISVFLCERTIGDGWNACRLEISTLYSTLTTILSIYVLHCIDEVDLVDWPVLKKILFLFC